MIETERLHIRKLNLDDAAFILRLLNEPSWIANIGDKHVHSLQAARQYLETSPLTLYRLYGYGLFLLETRHDHKPIGLCGLINREGLADVDLGFALLECCWGKGYAYEAALATLTHGKETHSIDRVVAITLESNHSCIRLLRKLNFQYERSVTLTGDPEELQLYSLSL